MAYGKEVDNIDLRILKILRKNARLSYREIGKQIGISTGTVSEHVKQMRKNGVILGFITTVAPEKMGLGVSMILKIRVSAGTELEEAERRLNALEETSCVHLVTGEIDMIALVRCRDQAHTKEVLNRVRTMDGVERMDSHVILNSITLCGECGCDCRPVPDP